MVELPATTKHSATAVRIAVPSGLALVAAMFPEVAGVVGVATPFAVAAVEQMLARHRRILEDTLRRGEVVDLSSEEIVDFVPMAYRFFLSARQGEYEHNLKLLAAFLSAELKSEARDPGSFLDMARRLEGLSLTSLRAIARIGEISRSLQEQGRPVDDGASVTVGDLCRPEGIAPFEARDAVDALSDLAGRGLLYSSSQSGYGGSQQSFSTTKPLRELLRKALDIAAEEAANTSQRT